jgi:hypothetical protein
MRTFTALPAKILCPAVLAAGLLLLSSRASAQTVTTTVAASTGPISVALVAQNGNPLHHRWFDRFSKKEVPQ